MLINNKTNISFQTIARKSLLLSNVFTTLENNLLQVKKTRKGSKSPLFSLLMISTHYLKMFLSRTLLSLHWSNFLSSSFFTKVSICLYFLLDQAKARRVCCMEEPSWELCYKSEKDGTNGHFSLAQDPNYRDWKLDSRKNSGKNISCQPLEILQSIYFPCVSKCHEFNSNLI